MTPLPNLMVAPTGARKTKSDHPNLPMTLPEIVAEAKACFDAGADGLHLHVRDAEGRHSLDADLYRDALAALKIAVPDMAIQITTEAVGIYTPPQQRAVIHAVKPDAVSISLAEMLADGDIPAATAFYQHCADTDIDVQHILYGEKDLNLMSWMLSKGHLDGAGLKLMFVLGRYSTDQQSSPADLDPFMTWLAFEKDRLTQPDWAVCAFGNDETACLSAAQKLGGKVRVGFENSVWNADGSRADNNAERVRDVIRSAHDT